ncbi:T9SS type A sorting domain-containing protein [Winogradskyella ouciana]|uniref:T9SS type A sorting domain-containing protein n=1 Tax=Winogradskyella ouciana TaxID=2608631 RepID=A0A7K1GIR9_9FLAO|nr:T9SS type A sorting domain-containing protein [Winogradskyella ouciana]MTE28169.1 T9SS type A sorting domain-containing protein [Winogradskyella ouciana]
MRKITLLLALLTFTFGFSQTVINFDATAFSPDPIGTGLGFMNVFENPKDGTVGAGAFSSGWGIPDLIAELDTGANSVTLKPNRVGDTADPFWITTGVFEGNKIMEANLYIQDPALNGTVFSFTGEVTSNTLDDSSLSFEFVTVVFIKVFASDFSSVLAEDSAVLAPGTFLLNMDATSYTSGENIQYGFQIIGPNINSTSQFDTEYNNLGNIVVQPAVLSTEEFELSDVSVYPNPTTSDWTIKSNSQTINSIEIFDLLGKQVMELEPNKTDVKIDASELNVGVYLAKIYSENGTKTIKLVKN